jgi:cell surface protein SprA
MILFKIEVGNVSMPLNSSLIRGAQSLFGVKPNCLENNGYRCFQSKITDKSVVSQGGGTIQDFDMFFDYDSDRHFFSVSVF